MGADQSGKQELPLVLMKDSRLFADLPAQSRVIGEFDSSGIALQDLCIAEVVLDKAVSQGLVEDVAF